MVSTDRSTQSYPFFYKASWVPLQLRGSPRGASSYCTPLSIFQGSVKRMVSTDSSTHPHSFIRRVECRSSLGFTETHQINTNTYVFNIEPKYFVKNTHIFNDKLFLVAMYTNRLNITPTLYAMNRSYVERHPNLKSFCYEYITY